MALSTLAKEQENFLRYAILIVDHTREALQDLVELNIKKKNVTFEEFLNQNQHEIFHLCYGFKCCQCHNLPPGRKRFLYPSQLELLFDKHNKLTCHKATNCSDFCCTKAKVGITTETLDITLARCLLVNCCLDVFWLTCLTAQGQTLEQFLNLNKHILYHLFKNNQKCCQCPAGFIFPRECLVITENEWRGMFSSVLLPCINDRKRISTGTTSVCSVAARPGINVKDIHPEIQGLILKWCCSVRNSVEKLVEFRNINFGHVTNAKLSDSNFKDFSQKTEDCILDIACFCGKEQNMKDAITNLHTRPIDARLCSHYQNILLENINRNEAINENINLQHRTTRQSIPKLVDKSCKIRKVEKRIDALETSNAKIKEDIQDIYKLVKEGPKRQRLIDQISAEIESHKKEATYLETEAVRQCIQLLESKNVVILSGREGSGKSRNSLEILRQLKEKNGDLDVFKLIGLHYVSDIVKCNVKSIVLFDDAFDKTSEQFTYDQNLLDHLYSYIGQNTVKFIFTIRKTVRHACHRLLSTHKLFGDLVDIDLHSEKFKLTEVEKEKMLTNYCVFNKIMISEKNDDTAQSVENETETDNNEANQSVPDQAAVILKREIMNEIIETDPFLGFPECCRLFTDNRNSTHLDASCFKWPSTVLVNDIEKLRMEGIDNYMIGLKYVILIYILTLGKSEYRTTICAIAKKDINAETCKQIYNVCYNMNVEVRTSDIGHVCKVLTGCYLVYKDKTYCFQHKAIQDSVIVSYSKINPKAILPLLRLNHIKDLIRLDNYTEQEDEIVIKISKQDYYEFAKTLIALIKSCDHRFFHRLMKSKIFIENDTHLSYQLFRCIHNEKAPEVYCSRWKCKQYITCYFPLYLLSHIGKLDDKMFTVNHTEVELLISVFIDQHITCAIIPNSTLHIAINLKDKHIAKWLLQNTDHSLLNYENIHMNIDIDSVLDYVQLIEENVNYDLIDMTMLFKDVFFICNFSHKIKQSHAVDWMMDNVDNALIDYSECICFFIYEIDSNRNTDFALLLHLLKKVNPNWIDINSIADTCCFLSCSVLIEWSLQNFDHEILDRKKLIDIAINYHEQFKKEDDDYKCTGYRMETVVEVIILQTPEIKRFNIDRLVDVANKDRWYRVLELLIKDTSDIPMNVKKIIENAFQQLDNDDVQDERDYDEEHDAYMTEHGDHMKEILGLIMKHYFDNIDVKRLIIETAYRAGLHKIAETVLLNKFDYIAYDLNTTLNILLSQQKHYGSIRFNKGRGKKLLSLIKTVNLNFIDLDRLMNDLCHLGHSLAVLWLLEKKLSYRFNMKNVMNKACLHGDLDIVLYLFKNYSAEDFDYKTAMILACQRKTLNICKWLWENIDRGVFDMKAALNNACKYDRCKVVEWILKDVDTGLYDIEAALLCACENGTGDNYTRTSMNGMYMSIHSNTYLDITKLLYERADKLTLDINAAFSAACKNYKSKIVYWIIETYDQNITGTETTNGNKNLVKSLDKTFLDIEQAITCIFHMDYVDVPEQLELIVDKSKIELLLRILKQSDLNIFDIYKVLTETCKEDLLEIFQLLLRRIDHACLNIGEVINIACRDGAFKIVKWSLENINIQLLDAHNVMVESCGFGWLDCLVLIWKHCDKYTLQAAMDEACTYGRLHITKWLLQNFFLPDFNLPLLLKESGRNGWEHIFRSLVTKFKFCRSDLQMTTQEALVNGNLEIIQLMYSYHGKDGFDMSTLPDKVYAEFKNENVVMFLLQNFNPCCLNLSILLKNACKFGWKDIASSIIDKKGSSLSDFTLAFETACEYGEKEIVQLLVENVYHKIFAVDKAMISVCIKGWDEIVELLLEKFNHTRQDIQKSLTAAFRHGNIDVVQSLLLRVDKNPLDVKKALNEACKSHMHEELVLWMLQNVDQLFQKKKLNVNTDTE